MSLTEGSICGKGASPLQILYDPNRLNYPVKRTNPEKGIGIDPKRQRITWEEAKEMITALDNIMCNNIKIGRREMLQSILTGYIESALSHAEYDKLEDGTFSGRIPLCKGVVAFGKTLLECEAELQSTLEDWIIVGFKLGHQLPVIEEYDMNRELTYESMATM